jgi:hypothetical protein
MANERFRIANFEFNNKKSGARNQRTEDRLEIVDLRFKIAD